MSIERSLAIHYKLTNPVIQPEIAYQYKAEIAVKKAPSKKNWR